MTQNQGQTLAAFAASLKPGDLMIRRGMVKTNGRHMLETVEGDTVTMAPQGGGMVGRISLEGLRAAWRKVTPEEIASVHYREALFTLDGLPVWIEGVTTGERWNGWACPWFTREAALAYLQGQAGGGWLSWSFDEETGVLKTWDPNELGTEEEECDEWPPSEIEGVLRYPLGAGCWTWETAPDPRHPEDED